MNAYKLDFDKLKRCVLAYHDQHGEYPYIIASEDVFDRLKEDGFTNSNLTISNASMTISADIMPLKITVDGREYSRKTTNNNSCVWNGARVLVDYNMKPGEVHIG